MRPAAAPRLTILMLAAAIGLLALGPVVAAQEPAAEPTSEPRTPTLISIAFEPSRMEGLPHYLAAKLTTEDGSAVIGERVHIRRTADVFGGRTVTIGRPTTDNAGVAKVSVEPREQVYKVTAWYGGSDTLEGAEIVDDVVFPAETVVIPEEVPRGGLVDPQLRPLADLMPAAIGTAVIVVWVVLLATTILTILRIRSSRRDEEADPETT